MSARAYSNARVSPRASLPNVPVFLVNETRSFFGLAKNISRNGIYVDNHIPCLVGEKHHLEMSLPMSDITINCNTDVVWCKTSHNFMEGTYSRGMKFVDINRETADKVDVWVKNHCESFV